MAKARFTAGRVAAFRCPEGKDQDFLWNARVPCLALRATPAGSQAYIFQERFESRTIRMTIGSPAAWTIPQAEQRARDLQRIIDSGRDPRQVQAETIAADAAKRRAEAGAVVIVGDVWPIYMREGKPRKKDAWKPR